MAELSAGERVIRTGNMATYLLDNFTSRDSLTESLRYFPREVSSRLKMYSFTNYEAPEKTR